jgi:hypothetical protein
MQNVFDKKRATGQINFEEAVNNWKLGTGLWDMNKYVSKMSK